VALMEVALAVMVVAMCLFLFIVMCFGDLS
jgi:hypothetical protein